MGGLSIGLSIFIVIIMLGLLVTVHELGHFWVAKLLGIKAYEVSIFVGPQLFHWKGKDGVEYSIRAIPIGAYVRFTDIDEEGNVIESDDPDLLIKRRIDQGQRVPDAQDVLVGPVRTGLPL